MTPDVSVINTQPRKSSFKLVVDVIRGAFGVVMLAIIGLAVAAKAYLAFNPPAYNYTDSFGHFHAGTTGKWEYEAQLEGLADDGYDYEPATWGQ
jgi:hypothetical protein